MRCSLRSFAAWRRFRPSVLGLFVAFGMGLFSAGGATPPASAGEFESRWEGDLERVWVGPDYWANRLQDWRLAQGRVECLEASPQRPMRTLHLLTGAATGDIGELVATVRIGALHASGKRSADTWAGLLLGAGGASVDHRLTAQVHQRGGADGGILVAVDGAGKVIFRDNNQGYDEAAANAAGALRPDELPVLAPAVRTGGGFVGDQTFDDVELRVEVRPLGEKYSITATALVRATGKAISSAVLRGVDPRDVDGGLALVSHASAPNGQAGYWFRDWKISGRKFVAYPGRAFGPIVATQYSLHRGTLKLTAQLPPLGALDADAARLEIRSAPSEPWKLAARARLVRPAFVFPFRVEKWDGRSDWQFRVVYELRQPDGRSTTSAWEGVVRRPPVDRDELVVAAVAGAQNVDASGPWNSSARAFPHADLVQAVAAQNPDLLFFAGDQVEFDSSPAPRQPLDKAQLDYLDKWCRWCWAFGELTRERPTVCLPGGQDLYQARLWGAGGRSARQSPAEGGYWMPAEFVNLVQRTQTSHLPDPIDPKPVDQEIDVFFTRWDYAGVSFAILEDRKFKSAPVAGREADVAGAELLGRRQEQFLRQWGADWSDGVWMKAVLSQSLLADVVTLPKDASGDQAARRRKLKPADYPADDRLSADPSSNAWPPIGRNAALREFRRAFAVHLAGDRQVGSLVRYGVDDWNDAGYGFNVPSLAGTGGRRWFPAETGAERSADAPRYTGRFKDGFGNPVTVVAAANPVESGREPAALHDLAPGYGIVRFQRPTRRITFECWPRDAHPGKADAKQFAGWPAAVDQLQNYGRAAAGYLPEVQVNGLEDPVVQVVDESTGEPVYTLRIRGASFRPPVYRAGRYTVRIGEPGTDQMKQLTGLEAAAEATAALTVDFAGGPAERVSAGTTEPRQ